MKIDLSLIKEITVEIGDVEYLVAKKTQSICNKINSIVEDAKRTSGIISASGMLETIQLILGKEAKKEIFPDGENSCYDKITLVYYGVLDAFNYNTESINANRRDKELEPSLELLDELSKKMTPLANFNREQLRAIKNS